MLSIFCAFCLGWDVSTWLHWQQALLLAYLGWEVQDATLLVCHKLAALPPDAGMPTQPQSKLKAVSALQQQFLAM